MSNVAATSNSSLGAVTNQTQFNTAYTQFLSMLTTELQNQDPTSPMDATQFTNQLVGFSQLEQQLQTNSNLQTLIADQQGGGMSAALGYLGHSVVAAGNAFQVPDNGTASIDYSLASTASSALVTVSDSSGQVVGSFAGSTDAGLNTIPLDGAIPGGADLPAGDYTFTVTAMSASGQPITATTYSAGQVTGIDTSSGAAYLLLGNIPVAASSVVQVSS